MHFKDFAQQKFNNQEWKTFLGLFLFLRLVIQAAHQIQVVRKNDKKKKLDSMVVDSPIINTICDKITMPPFIV